MGRKIQIFIGLVVLIVLIVGASHVYYLMTPCKLKRVCFAQNLNENERTLLVELVKTTGGILDGHDIPWIPVAGSLLAVYRHDKFIIPWDDDYDITIREEDAPRALAALSKQLVKIGATLTKVGQQAGVEDWGILYKVHFQPDDTKPDIRQFLGKKYTWPFVDIFIGGTETGPMGVKAITDEDLPLSNVIVDGISMHLPSRGPRSLESFMQRPELMKNGVEQMHSHRFESAYCGCTGPKEKKLSDRPSKYIHEISFVS